ncbi:MAG: 1-acyl-sn-glycerol-3-phosphate acyltransferase [Lewinellaceae bacterium]|nr:1-acyl-sn-glycerol-3-phosphate acyltransferase [Saprospiraceae bacterium]MCB9342480.1 1-acyl-sn-glycerol-3-phosphate acyltransferase [Lewinellaceae bacterium]
MKQSDNIKPDMEVNRDSSKLRALWRLSYFIVYSIRIILEIILTNWIKGSNPEHGMRIRRKWARNLLPNLGVKVMVEGNPPDYPCILMANHRSYLDPAVVVHDAIACPVSKAEVAKWPLIGYGAKVSGVIFLKRESRHSRKRTLQGIADKVAEGYPVLLFPEGTTHAELLCRTFKPGGFRLAAQHKIAIVPVAIEYQSAEDCWIGNDTFLPHFMRRFALPEMPVMVRYGKRIDSEDPDYLIKTSTDWINEQLKTMQKSLRGSEKNVEFP